MTKLVVDGTPVKVDGVESRVDVFLDGFKKLLRSLEGVS